MGIHRARSLTGTTREKVLAGGNQWGIGLRVRFNFFRGVLQSLDTLYSELSRTDLFLAVPEVKMPVYFCLGRHDYEVPSELSAKYFEVLKAPRKQLVWFQSSAHMPNTEEKDKFNEFMINRVLPALPE